MNKNILLAVWISLLIGSSAGAQLSPTAQTEDRIAAFAPTVNGHGQEVSHDQQASCYAEFHDHCDHNGNCTTPPFDQLAESDANSDALEQCKAQHFSSVQQTSDWTLSHSSEANPQPYGYNCYTSAQASFACTDADLSAQPAETSLSILAVALDRHSSECPSECPDSCHLSCFSQPPPCSGHYGACLEQCDYVCGKN